MASILQGARRRSLRAKDEEIQRLRSLCGIAAGVLCSVHTSALAPTIAPLTDQRCREASMLEGELTNAFLERPFNVEQFRNPQTKDGL